MTGTASLSAKRKLFLRTTTALCACATGLGLTTAVHAQSVLPTGGSVQSGTATIGQAPGSVTINQTSTRAIVNWGSFSVGVNDRVTFNQPDAQSATLNRVTSSTTSRIAGRITGTGAVYVVNPNGIVITPTGSVQTGGGFIASTLDIADADFNAGKLYFTGKGASASVSNAGTVVAGSGAYVALLGGSVANSGTITVPMGRVGFGSGERIALDLSGDGLLQVGLPTAADTGGAALIDHSGLITAAGGYIQMSAATAKDAVRNVINIPGTLIVDSASGQGGRIVLLGGAGGTVTASGTLSARSGGASDGGSVETSGATVDFAGLRVDVRAANGKTGTWLVDPTDLTVDAGAAAAINANLATANVTLMTDGYGTVTGPGVSSSGAGDIIVNGALGWSSTNTLTLSAYHNIAINAAITATNGGLTLVANNSGYQPASIVSATGSIAVGNFQLTTGNWVQNAATLPGFSARDFSFNPQNASFLRSTGGDGSAANPYLLTDVYGLQGMRAYSLLGQNFALANDVDAAGTANWNAGAGFAPIGDNAPFNGSLDGKGHAISSLTINRPNESFIGLFSRVNGTLSNLTLLGGSITGYYAVGGLVGTQASGSITNVSSSVTVNGFSQLGGLVGAQQGSIANSSASGAVSGSADNVGGLVGLGYATATITGSHANGNVTVVGRASGVGGLVGSTAGSIDQSYATGTVAGSNGAGSVGGLVGNICSRSNGCSADTAPIATITNSYATGNVSADNGSMGGLVGTLSNVNITNAYATGSVTDLASDQGIGGLIGATSGTNSISLVQATGDVRGYSSVGGLIGNASGTTSISQSYASGHVYGSFNLFGGLVGYLNNAASITSSYATGAVDHLQRSNDYGTSLGGLVGQALGTISYSYATGAVSSAYNDNVGGLVGNFLGSGTLSDSHATGAVTGGDYSYVGGLVGYLSGGNIANSYATGAVSAITTNSAVDVGGLVGSVATGSKSDIVKSFATGNVTASTAPGSPVGAARDYVGGLIGDNEGWGLVDQVYASGAVSGDGGTSDLGGLIGRFYDHGLGGVVSQAYSTGSVTASGTNPAFNYVLGNPRGGYASHQNVGGLIGSVYGTVNETYATGLITGGNLTGGLVAYNEGGPGTSSSYWNTLTTGQADSAAGTGRTTAQMQDVTNFGTIFAGWDFTHVWAPPSAGYYPQLLASTPVISIQVYNQSTLYGTAPAGPLGAYYGGPSSYVFGPANDTLAGFVPYSTTATVGSNAGVYAITPFSGSTFLSSGGVNYRVVSSGPAILTINPLVLTVLTAGLTGTTTKSYDGTTTASLTPDNFLLSGFINGDGAQVTQTVGTYGSANVGTGIFITATLTASDFHANTGTFLGNYALPTSAGGAIGIVNPASLSATLTGSLVGKAYDGMTAATLGPANFLLSGFAAGEGAAVTQTVGNYASPNAGTTVVNANLAPGDLVANNGTSLSNYIVPTIASGAIGSISPLNLTVALTGTTSKNYDGTNVATLNASNFVLSGFLGGEGAQVSAIGSYASVNVGSGITVTTSLTPGNFAGTNGTDIGNYVIPTSALSAAIGTITPASLTAALIGSTTKAYDGTTTATLGAGNFQLSGFASGEGAQITKTVATYAGPNVGNTLVTASLAPGDFVANSGTAFSNYILPTSASGGIGTITPLALTATLTGTTSKTYDGTTAATLTPANFTLSGFLAREGAQVTQTTGSFASPNVGSGITVTATLTPGNLQANSNTLIGNYIVPTSASAEIGTITATNLTVVTAALTGVAKTYDGTTAATLNPGNFLLSGFVGSDGARITQTVGTFASANAGTGIAVTANLAPGDFLANGGTNIGNYVLPTSAIGMGTIDPATLTVTYSANPRSAIYGSFNPIGSTYAVSGSYVVSGLIGNDTASQVVAGGAAFSTAASPTSNVGTYAITGRGITSNSGNYTVANVQTASNATAFSITPRDLLITYYAAPKEITYGSPIPALTGSVGAIGLVNTDTFADATSGNAIFTTPATSASNVGMYGIYGSGLSARIGGNYNVTFTQGDFNAQAFNIRARVLSIVNATLVGNTTKVYDGTTTATINANNFLLTGFVNGDGATVTKTTGYYANPNVGTNVTVGVNLTPTDFVAKAGTLLGNYILPTQAFGAIGTITRAPLYVTYTANPATNVYGGIYTNQLTGTVSVTGYQGTDTQASVSPFPAVQFQTSATSRSNVGTYAITGRNFSANNNYTIIETQADSNATAFTVTPASLTIVYRATTANSYYGEYLSIAEAAAQPNFSGLDRTGPTASVTGAYFSGGPDGTITDVPLHVLTGTLSTSGVLNTVNGPVMTSGLVNGDTIASVTSGQAVFNTTATHLASVGTYAIVGSGLTATSPNYVTTFAQDNGNARALTISPRQLTVRINAQTRAYGAANPALTYLVLPSEPIPGAGLVNGDALSGNLLVGAIPGSAPGQYLIAQGTLHASPNYNATYTTAYLTVTPPTSQTVISTIPRPTTPSTPTLPPVNVVARPPVIPVYSPPPPPPPPPPLVTVPSSPLSIRLPTRTTYPGGGAASTTCVVTTAAIFATLRVPPGVTRC